MSEDPLIRESEEAEREAGGMRTDARVERAANLFDLRRIIGGLFVLYGIVLTIVGLTDGQAEIHKAAGVHINLWAGIGMLVLGILFLIWAFTRPLGRQLREEEAASQQARRRAG
jgi:hypothetical protein